MSDIINACDRLADIYREKQSQGLVDVKYLVRRDDETTVEEICAEALRLEEAIAAGRTSPLKFNDIVQ